MSEAKLFGNILSFTNMGSSFPAQQEFSHHNTRSGSKRSFFTGDEGNIELVGALAACLPEKNTPSGKGEQTLWKDATNGFCVLG